MTKKIGLIVGIVFLLIGVLGFISNPIVGTDGLFESNTILDLVHLVSGILLIIVAVSATHVLPIILKVFGVVYLLIAVLGFMAVPNDILGLIATNGASNILHVVLGVLLIVLGSIAKAPETNGSSIEINQTPPPMA